MGRFVDFADDNQQPIICCRLFLPSKLSGDCHPSHSLHHAASRLARYPFPTPLRASWLTQRMLGAGMAWRERTSCLDLCCEILDPVQDLMLLAASAHDACLRHREHWMWAVGGLVGEGGR